MFTEQADRSKLTAGSSTSPLPNGAAPHRPNVAATHRLEYGILHTKSECLQNSRCPIVRDTVLGHGRGTSIGEFRKRHTQMWVSYIARHYWRTHIDRGVQDSPHKHEVGVLPIATQYWGVGGTSIEELTKHISRENRAAPHQRPPPPVPSRESRGHARGARLVRMKKGDRIIGPLLDH